jgi:hypothetical protein
VGTYVVKSNRRRRRRRRRRMYTGVVPLRNSRGPYYIHVSFVCYGYSLPFTISQPKYPVKHLPS